MGSVTYDNSEFGGIVFGGSGNDLINNNFSASFISGDAGNDYFINGSDSSAIYGGAGKDNVENSGDKVSINGGTGNDYIYNSGAEVSIDLGAGKDYICNEGSKISILGGAGNDKIYNFGDHITIASGAGNDSIKNDGGKHITYQFGKTSGKDTVVGIAANDTIKITSGSYSTKQKGNDVIVSVKNSSMILKNAVGIEINFISASGKTSTKTFSAKSANVPEFWFAAENDFAIDDNLSSIVEVATPAIAYDEIETLSSRSLTQNNNLLAYSKTKTT